MTSGGEDDLKTDQRRGNRRDQRNAGPPVPHPLGHNKRPAPRQPSPLGEGPVGRFLDWKATVDAVWKKIPPEIAIRRARKAEALGLTYAEYTLEILERSRHLQATDTERILEIRLRRPLRD